MLEVVVAFIWLALSYIVYYMIDREEARKSRGKMFSIFTGFAVNSILCFAYAWLVSTGAKTAAPIKSAFILNAILYLYLFVFSGISTTTEEISESIRHTVKKMGY